MRLQPLQGKRGARRVPVLLLIPAVFAIVFLVVPIIGLLQKVVWGDLFHDLTTPQARAAIALSLRCSLWATVLAVLFGVPLAWLLARVEFRGRAVVRALALLPLVLPPVVGGVALLSAFGRRGLIGEPLDAAFGIHFTFTATGVVLAETFVALPFVVITVEAALRAMDRRLEDAASTLGASRFTVLRRITFPAIAPALAGGVALAWARALGEFGATITFAGNIEGRTRTAPLAVYLLLDSQPQTAIALSLVMVAICIGVLTLLRGRWLVRQ